MRVKDLRGKLYWSKEIYNFFLLLSEVQFQFKYSEKKTLRQDSSARDLLSAMQVKDKVRERGGVGRGNQ